MGITGLLPFIDKASRRINVSEFNGSTVAIDSYCWLHKGAFACADKLVRGEETDIHIKYCLKYVTMLLSKNIKPILVFDGRHLPAKAMTESKRRESRDISKKRAAELLSLGKIEEARSYMRRSVDITHEMALSLIQECRKRNVDCIVAPYEADAQLAYLNMKNIAHLVITEDSDLILFGCTKVLFKMDLEGSGTLVETIKLPLAMKCPIEQYTFDKFRQMCIMSGCDYLASLPGIGLAKARQFVTATQDPNFANALKKLPSFFNRSSLMVTDEYRENFLKAEATFKHQYVYDPLDRSMVRLTDPDDEDIEKALCVNAGELLEPKTAFQLALGNLDPFTLRKMDDWHPDKHSVDAQNNHVRTNGWREKGVSNHPSIWDPDFKQHLSDPRPWQKKEKKPEPNIAQANTRPSKKVINLVSKYVPETEDQSLSIQYLSNMYCVERSPKRQKVDCEGQRTNLSNTMTDCHTSEISRKDKSPILENKERSFKRGILKKLSRFPRTIVDSNVVESKFFSTSHSESEENNLSKDSITIEESPEKCSRNPFKVSRSSGDNNLNSGKLCEYEKESCRISRSSEEIDLNECLNNSKHTLKEFKNIGITDLNSSNSLECDKSPLKQSRFLGNNDLESRNSSDHDQIISIDIDDNHTDLDRTIDLSTSSQKENSPYNSPVKIPKSPILEPSPRHRNLFKRLDRILDKSLSEDSVIENTYPMETLVTPVDSQESFGKSPPKPNFWSSSQPLNDKGNRNNGLKKSNCKVPGLKKTTSLPNNQPTLVSMFGFQKKPALKR